MSDPTQIVKIDLTDETRATIAESTRVAETSLQDAMDLLLGMEKKCRQGNDFDNLREVVLHMVRLCQQKGDWAKLCTILQVIAKRRAQHKSAITAIVQESVTFVDQTPSEAVKVELIKTLKDICEGKMYVEGEGARLTLQLALIREKEGKLGEACDIVQDVQVETYGSLSRLEKAEYIIEQVRLNLKRRDFVRALIQSRKMNRKLLSEPGFEMVNIRFYSLMSEYNRHERDAWELCQCYHSIASTNTTALAAVAGADVDVTSQALRSAIVFLLLSPFSSTQQDMLHRTAARKDVESMPEYAAALKLFTTQELVAYPFETLPALLADPALAMPGPDGVTSDLPHWTDMFHRRVVQHNLRVIAKYYTRITMPRLAALLSLSSAQVEEYLADACERDEVALKIDRPGGVVIFGRARSHDEVLSDWNSDIGKLLHTMESTCHLINRELMVHMPRGSAE